MLLYYSMVSVHPWVIAVFRQSRTAERTAIRRVANQSGIPVMEDERGKVRGLIDMAINSTARELDPRLLKAVKSVVRDSDSELRLAAETLMELMKRDHAQVRYLALLIIDELFMRSKLFRTIIVENLDHLLSWSVGFRRHLPLPAPPAIAVLLRSKAIEFLEKWNSSYGIHYRKIRLGFEYLKNILKFQFPNLQANAARIQNEKREREQKSKEILQSKFELLRTNLLTIEQEIQSTIDELEECLDIVYIQEDNMPANFLLDDSDTEFEEFRSTELHQIRLDSLNEGKKKARENSDNKVVFDTVRELYKLLVTKHLVTIQDWISVLIRVEVTDDRFRDSTLKEFIDIQNRLKSAKKKCEESGCYLPSTEKHNVEEEEEDIWEEGKTESREIVSPTSRNLSNSIAECSSSKKSSVVKETLARKSRTNIDNPVRSKLLAEAPVKKWSSGFDIWHSNLDVLANQRGLDIESHWGRVDHDALIPAAKIAELSLQATRYEEEQVEIKPCHAPLKKGGLCQRRDIRVCPFHGLIIPRDSDGNPINQNSLEEVTSLDLGSLDLGTDTIRRLAKQALKNVRENERKIDKRLVKRAKLAKIREHNEEVLRDAAMASTSRSAHVGEDITENSRSKGALASMLRKKVSSKDRLARKLLSSRATAATMRQLTLGEDSNYNEAFSNQW